MAPSRFYPFRHFGRQTPALGLLPAPRLHGTCLFCWPEKISLIARGVRAFHHAFLCCQSCLEQRHRAYGVPRESPPVADSQFPPAPESSATYHRSLGKQTSLPRWSPVRRVAPSARSSAAQWSPSPSRSCSAANLLLSHPR